MSFTKENLVVLYSSGASMNNMPEDEVVSGSVVSTVRCGLYKTALFKVASGSATSTANEATDYYIDWSYDGTGWHGADGTNLEGLSGSFSVMNKWYAVDLNKAYPYVRLLMVCQTGSTISGSMVLLGLVNS